TRLTTKSRAAGAEAVGAACPPRVPGRMKIQSGCFSRLRNSMKSATLLKITNSSGRRSDAAGAASPGPSTAGARGRGRPGEAPPRRRRGPLPLRPRIRGEALRQGKPSHCRDEPGDASQGAEPSAKAPRDGPKAAGPSWEETPTAHEGPARDGWKFAPASGRNH